MNAQKAALRRLAAAAPRDLCTEAVQAGPLYRECNEAGLFRSEHAECTEPSERRLQQFFDAALDSGLSSLVAHYVDEVCLDPRVSSSNPVEARLLDGGVVHSWAAGTFAESHQTIERLSTQGTAEVVRSADVLQQTAERTRGLSNVLAMLQVPSKSAQGMASPKQLYDDAQRTAQYMAVLRWCTRHHAHLHDKLVANEWLSSRLRIQGEALFIEDALHMENIWDPSTAPIASVFPPRNWVAAARAIYLQGSPDVATFKHGIFVYYLFALELASCGKASIVEDFARSFHVSQQAFMECYVYYLLDDSAPESFELACQLLRVTVHAGTAYKVAWAVLQRGAADVALTILQARADADHVTPISRLDAEMALRVRLGCGLLGEAVLQLRSYWRSLPQAEQIDAVQSLTRQLCNHCLQHGTMPVLLALPLELEEESALCHCLKSESVVGPLTHAADYLVGFYLQRGRYVEAAAEHADLIRLQQSPEGLAAVSRGSQQQQQRLAVSAQQRQDILAASVLMLPSVQQALVVGRSQSAGSPVVQLSEINPDYTPPAAQLVQSKPTFMLETRAQGDDPPPLYTTPQSNRKTRRFVDSAAAEPTSAARQLASPIFTNSQADMQAESISQDSAPRTQEAAQTTGQLFAMSPLATAAKSSRVSVVRNLQNDAARRLQSPPPAATAYRQIRSYDTRVGRSLLFEEEARQRANSPLPPKPFSPAPQPAGLALVSARVQRIAPSTDARTMQEARPARESPVRASWRRQHTPHGTSPQQTPVRLPSPPQFQGYSSYRSAGARSAMRQEAGMPEGLQDQAAGPNDLPGVSSAFKRARMSAAGVMSRR
eukprot:jgi/Chlat1/5114/Chrsp33S05117